MDMKNSAITIIETHEKLQGEEKYTGSLLGRVIQACVQSRAFLNEVQVIRGTLVAFVIGLYTSSIFPTVKLSLSLSFIFDFDFFSSIISH